MASTTDGFGRKAAVAGLWALTVLDAAMMALAGYSKFGNPEWWTRAFEGWGYPGWFALCIGGAELGLALALLVPRVAAYAASGLIVIMLGAFATVLLHPGRMGPIPPLMHVVVLSIILSARWRRRWRPWAPSVEEGPMDGELSS